MKYLLSLFFLMALLLPPAHARADDKLYVSLWAEYIPSWVFQEFTKETGIKVVPKFYAQRHAVYNQLLETLSHMDLVMVCQDQAERFKASGDIMPIDYSRFKNVDNLGVLPPREAGRGGFSHTLPFNWHVMGLIVNRDLVDADMIKSFADLWRPEIRAKVFLPEEPRVLASLGLLVFKNSPNSADNGQLRQAFEKINELIPLVNECANYGMVDAFNSGSAAVTILWRSAPELFKLTALPNMVFILPEGKPLIMMESWIIPVTAQNQNAAYAFMDFIMRPDIADRISREVGFPTINRAVEPPQEISGNVLLNPSPELIENAWWENYTPAIDRIFGKLGYEMNRR